MSKSYLIISYSTILNLAMSLIPLWQHKTLTRLYSSCVGPGGIQHLRSTAKTQDGTSRHESKASIQVAPRHDGKRSDTRNIYQLPDILIYMYMLIYWYLWCEDLIAQLRSGVPTKICCHLRPKGKQDKPSSASKRIPARLSRCRIQCRWQTWHLLNLIVIASQLLDRTKLSVLRPDFDGPLMQRDASRKRIQLAEMLFCSLSFQSLGDRTLVLSWANPTPSRQAPVTSAQWL